MSSVAHLNKQQFELHQTTNNTYDDFQVGDSVQIVCICQDFCFFDGVETGKVIKNEKRYLGIIVELDYEYRRLTTQNKWNFEPQDLKKI